MKEIYLTSNIVNQATVIKSEKQLYAKITRRIIPFLFICFVSNYLDRVNVGIAKLQMQSDLHFSETTFGLGMGVFFIGYFIFEVPSNIILQKVGASKWIARIIISWGLVSGCMMFVKTPAVFYIMRFLLGVAEAGFFPGIILYLTYWFPTYRRCKAVALFFTALPVASMIGSPVSGWIINSLNGIRGLLGWQWLFLLESIPSLVLGIIALFYLDDGIDNSKWLSKSEKSILKNNIKAESSNKRDISMKEVFSNANVWYLILIFFFLLLGLYVLIFWTPTIIKGSGIKNTFTIGILSAIPNFLAVLAMVFVSRSSDKHKERRWHLAICSFIGAIGVIICAIFYDSTLYSMIGLSIATVGVFSCFPVFWSLPTAFLGGAAAAAGIAMINAVGNTAGFVSNYFVGWIKELTNSTSGSLFILAILLITASILILSKKQIKHLESTGSISG